MMDSKQIEKVFSILLQDYPDPSTELHYESPFQLLISVILSAQCTDERVNRVTPELFLKFPTAQTMAKAKAPEIEKLIHSCGFFKMKTKSLLMTSQALLGRFDGEVPNTIEELVTLPGVGRKTASVVLNQAFNLPAIAVDTHVKRVSNRLDWATSQNPHKIELELKALIPKSRWSSINGLLILHGRKVCKARKPLCGQCRIKEYCSYYLNT